MKKIVISLCCLFLMSGCQKSIDVITTTDGFQVEKIGSISRTSNKVKYNYLMNCKENTLCFSTEEYLDDTKCENKYYEINIKDKLVVETELEETNNEDDVTYVSRSEGSVYYYDSIYSLSENEQIIETEAHLNDDLSTVKISYVYQSDKETSVLYEYTFNKDTENEVFSLIPYLGALYRKDDQNYMFLYVENNQLAVDRIQPGKHKIKEKRIPLFFENMQLVGYDAESEKTDKRIYQNEEKKLFYLNGKTVELNFSDTVTQIDENTIIVQEVEKEKVVNNYIYNFETGEKIKMNKVLNGFIYSDYDYFKGESDNWLFRPTEVEVSETSQFFNLGKINEDVVELKELPFETNAYLFESIDEKQIMFVNIGENDTSFDFYLVSVE